MVTATLQKAQTTCNRCPKWQASERTQNVGYCPLYDQNMMGHDKRGHNCPEPLNLYKIDLFQDGEWVREEAIWATSVRHLNAIVLRMGDYGTNNPRLCHA